MLNKNMPIKNSNIYNNWTNLTFTKFNQLTVRCGNMNRDNPNNNDNQPIRVIITVQLFSQILWKRIFNKPIIMAINDVIITNFWSFKSRIICTILFGLKLNIKKKIIKYHPQNLAKKVDVFSIIIIFYSSCKTKKGTFVW